MPSVKILAIVALLWPMIVEGVGIDRGALAAALRRPLYLLRAFVVVFPFVTSIYVLALRSRGRGTESPG
ncbi:MAG TPA: hypothetical protein VN033_01545 [Vulgatibacter sp.]|nr:hypothetical protein [Vulgatibacter sp.]